MSKYCMSDCAVTFKLVLPYPRFSWYLVKSNLDIHVSFKIRVTCTGSCPEGSTGCKSPGIDTSVGVTINMRDLYPGYDKCFEKLESCWREDTISAGSCLEGRFANSKECASLRTALVFSNPAARLEEFVLSEIAATIGNVYCRCTPIITGQEHPEALQHLIQNSLDERSKRRLGQN
jgi:hypothetical protein